MNLNLCLDDETARELDQMARDLEESRSGLIRKALREWLNKQRPGNPAWLPLILEWTGAAEAPAFESHRGELPPPRDDIFA